MAIFGCICTATIMISTPFIFGVCMHKAIIESFESGLGVFFGLFSIAEWFLLVWMLAKLNGLA